MPPSAMTGTLCAAAARAHSMIGRNHRHADAGNHSRRANRSGADADLDGVDTALDERFGRFRRRHVAGNQIDARMLAANARDHVEHALRMAVRRVDDDDVDVRSHQRSGTFGRIARNPDSGADAQPAQGVLAGVRILDLLLDVLDRDQALELEIAIDDEQLLDFVAVKDLSRGIERGADRHRDEVLARHHRRNRTVDVCLEAQVAVRENADEPAFFRARLGDRHARNPVFLHQLERFVDAVLGRQRDRVDDHAALGSLHAIDFRRLLFDREILVDDADAAVLRHGDGQPGFRDGIHRRAGDRHVQLNVAREPARDVDLARNDRRMSRHQKHIVKCERGREVGDDVDGAQLKD